MASKITGISNKENEEESFASVALEHVQVYWALYVAMFIFLAGLACILYEGPPRYEETYEIASGAIVSLINNDIITSRIAFFSGVMLYIGVVVAFLGVVFQGRYRVNIEVLSKNRQDWINDLRKHLANSLAIGEDTMSIFESFRYSSSPYKKTVDGYGDRYAQRREILRKDFLAQFYYIKLLLSISQQKHDIDKALAEELLSALEDVKGYVIFDLSSNNIGAKIPAKSDIARSLDLLTLQGEKIIKREWKKVKRGA